jgi:hypothetical protein
MKIEEFRSKSAEVPIGVVLTASSSIWEVKKTVYRNPLDRRSGVRRRPRYAFFAKGQGSDAHLRQAIEDGATLKGRQWPSAPAFLDAWEIREDFLSLQSEADCLQFLNKVGRFSRSFGERGDWDFNDFRWQLVFREFLKRSPAMWYDYLVKLKTDEPGFNVRLIHYEVAISMQASFRLRLKWRGPDSSAVVWVRDAVSAIIASIYVDHLRGLKFRFCARPDCRKPFEVTSRHKRKYCQQYCAHLESLRRKRKRPKTKK